MSIVVSRGLVGHCSELKLLPSVLENVPFWSCIRLALFLQLFSVIFSLVINQNLFSTVTKFFICKLLVISFNQANREIKYTFVHAFSTKREN